MAKRSMFPSKRSDDEIDLLKKKIEEDAQLISKLERKVESFQGRKSKFFSSLSHDLRTPLSLIIGNLELAMEDKDSYYSPATKQAVETCYKNCKRLIYLTQEIDDIGHFDRGTIRLKREQVQIVPFLKVLADMFISSARYKGIDLTFETTLSSNESVIIDSRQFEKIYLKLISNAIRHCIEGDSIKVTASKLEDKILIEFKDTGQGIDEDTLPHIFDRFHRSKDGIREGTGLGLAMVNELIKLHEGEISVSSQVGQGTSFVVSLQASGQKGMKATLSDYIQSQSELIMGGPAATTIVPDGTLEKKARILIVDDHPEIRYYIRQILEDQYVVKEAAHGLEALELLANQQIDLIVTDLMMPWMDGFELIESIHNSPEYQKIPMLIVSARISDNDREKALIKGINNFLQKPFDKKELVLRINNLLSTVNNQDSFDSLANRQNLEVYGVEILKKVENFIQENIDDTNLGVLQLADAIAASERQVYRLIKKVTGKTPYEYITEVRLQYADYLIRKNKVRSASEVARNVGIKNVTTFNRQYEKRFGAKPSELLENA